MEAIGVDVEMHAVEDELERAEALERRQAAGRGARVLHEAACAHARQRAPQHGVLGVHPVQLVGLVAHEVR